MLSPASATPLDRFATFGELLKYLRRRERLTQLELSVAVGYSEAQISRLEKNMRLPDLTALSALFIPALHLEQEPVVVERLIALARAARAEEGPAPGAPPYKGLLYMDEADAGRFFGREALTEKLVSQLTATTANGRRVEFCRFLAIIGASGSGKSSFVRAGLVPALKHRGWQTYAVTPTEHPLATLSSSWMDEIAHVSSTSPFLLAVDQFEELFTLCREEDERREFMRQLLALASDPAGSVSVVVALRADFYAHLAPYPDFREAVAQHQEYLGPMMADELRRTIEEPAHRGGWSLEPGLVEVLLKDVGAVGNQPPEPGALPLLEHALLETWERRRGRTLTLEGYQASGGVHGAIAETAETVFNDGLDAREQTLARNIFQRLTELGEGTEDTRRRAHLDELTTDRQDADRIRAVLLKLTEARLLTASEQGVEVAHEALIREWQRLREWLNEDREGLRLHRHLTVNAREWEALGRDSGALYRGVRLAQAAAWNRANPESLNELERAFLEASSENERREAAATEAHRRRELAAAQKLAEEQARRAQTEAQRAQEQTRAAKELRRRAYFLASASGLTILLAAIALFFGNQASQNAATAQQNAASASHSQATAVANADSAQKARSDAVAQRDAAQTAKLDADTQRDIAQNAEAQAIAEKRIATARELAASALNNLDVDPERSILLAMQAVTTTYAIDHTTTREAVEALHRAVQNSRLRLTLHPDTGDNGAVAFSPDGRRLATGGEDGQVKLWDIPSGGQVLAFPAHDQSINNIAFSPDGARLATASSDGTVRVWDSSTGHALNVLNAHAGGAEHVAFSRDGGRLVTAGDDKTAKVWNAATGKLLQTLSGHTDIVASAVFSPDGTRIATAGNDKVVKLWDAATGIALRTLTDFDILVNAVAFSPDGTRLATAGDQYLKIWDVATGKVVLTLLGPKNATNGLVFTSDGKYLATAGQDGTAIVWNATTGQEYLSLPGASPLDGGLDISPGCVSPPNAAFEWCGVYLATAARDKSVKLWDISPAGSRELLTVPGVLNFINQDSTLLVTTTFSPTASIQNRVWRLPQAPTALINAADESANNADQLGRQVSSYFAGTWDFPAIVALNADQTRSGNVSVDPNAPATSTRTQCSGQAAQRCVSAAFIARIFDTTTGKELLRFPLMGQTAQTWYGGISFSPDGRRLATSSLDGTAKVWDLANGGKELFALTGQTTGIYRIVYSPDGTQIATAGKDKTARIWDAQTGKELLTLRGHDDAVDNLVFSPDGTRLATSSFDTTARVWDLTTGKQLLTLTGHTATIWGLAYSADGKLISTTSPDGTARIWDARTGEQLLVLSVPNGAEQVNFTPDGTRLVTSNVIFQDVRVYLLQVEDLMALARTRVTRGLTNDECQSLLHLEQCPPAP